MTAIYSSTYDSKYSFFIPLTAWCWQRLGIKSICLMPVVYTTDADYNKWLLLEEVIEDQKLNLKLYDFYANKNQEATYSQVARLYAASLIEDNEEVLISTDVDMAVFKNIFDHPGDFLWNIGMDLVPEGQLPMCYTWGKAVNWAFRFGIKSHSLQECLDEQLKHEECEHMRGNLWSRDQELLFKAFSSHNYHSTVRLLRARPGTRFASHRYDRDDAYLLERLNPDTIDYHLPRPGYEENNFNQILTVLKYHYPDENFEWLIQYRERYVNLIQK